MSMIINNTTTTKSILNHEEILDHLKKITNVNPFIG